MGRPKALGSAGAAAVCPTRAVRKLQRWAAAAHACRTVTAGGCPCPGTTNSTPLRSTYRSGSTRAACCTAIGPAEGGAGPPADCSPPASERARLNGEPLRVGGSRRVQTRCASRPGRSKTIHAPNAMGSTRVQGQVPSAAALRRAQVTTRSTPASVGREGPQPNRRLPDLMRLRSPGSCGRARRRGRTGVVVVHW